MERLTRKLKKGGYSANRHSEAQLTERLDQLKGVHKQWLQDVSDMMTGMKQSEAAGQEGALTLMMLQAGYAAIVRIGRRFESVCPPVEGSGDDTATALGKLEDLYEQCVSELEDVKEGLEECRENGFTDDLAYDELMVTKLGISQLIKQFDIATGYSKSSTWTCGGISGSANKEKTSAPNGTEGVQRVKKPRRVCRPQAAKK